MRIGGPDLGDQLAAAGGTLLGLCHSLVFKRTSENPSRQTELGKKQKQGWVADTGNLRYHSGI